MADNNIINNYINSHINNYINNENDNTDHVVIQGDSTPRSQPTSDSDPVAIETGRVEEVTAAVKDMNVIFVQDVSGSMENQRRSVVNGINEIIGDLKKRYAPPCEHKATIRIIKFSSSDNISIGPSMPVHDVPTMNLSDLICDGVTALWDATAIAIARMNTDSAGVPATTYIFTDGENNDSKNYTLTGVNAMIAENKQKNPMHSVLFIGSDPSARRSADDMGLDRIHSIHHDSENTPVAYEVCKRALGRCVSGDTQSTEFNESDIVMSETPSLRRAKNATWSPNWQDTLKNCELSSHEMVDSQPDADYMFESDDIPSLVSLHRTQSSR